MRLSTGLVLGSTVLLVRSQSVHTVTVGQFYIPPTISALEGDVVQFLFAAGHHGVTQGVGISNPCSQLRGGFNSGIVSGTVANDTTASPSWSLTITNASEPIFFYCAATVPSFHCANGMVGSINAEPDQYTSYSLAAKSVTGTPVQTSSVVLSGVGASATAAPFTPMPSVLLITSTTSFSDDPSSTATSSSSALPSESSASPSKSSSSNIAAIGGGIGGGIASCIIALLGFLLFRAKHKRGVGTAEAFGREDGEKYDPSKDPVTPPGLGGFDSSNMHQRDAFSLVAPASTAQYNRSTSSCPASMDVAHAVPYSRATTYTQGSSGFSGPLSEPPSGGFPGQVYGIRTADSSTPANMTFYPQPQYPAPMQGSNLNVHEIAKEVASLLDPQLRIANGPIPVSSPGAGAGAGAGRALPNPHTQIRDYNEPPKSPAPPQYNRYGSN